MERIELVNFSSEQVKNDARPVRQCALERIRSREDELLRFVLDPQGRVVPDIKRKLPGRGVWITAHHQAVDEAVRRKVFARSFRQAVTVPPDLASFVSDLLRQAALQDLAFANKAGAVVTGFAKVEKALSGKKAACLVHASDAASDGCRKLDRLALAISGGGAEAPAPIVCFASAELSASLGKSNVMHAAVGNGGAAQKFRWSATRLMNYMGTRPAALSVADTPEQDQE
jgi:uncharacterized protein